ARLVGAQPATEAQARGGMDAVHTRCPAGPVLLDVLEQTAGRDARGGNPAAERRARARSERDKQGKPRANGRLQAFPNTAPRGGLACVHFETGPVRDATLWRFGEMPWRAQAAWL